METLLDIRWTIAHIGITIFSLLPYISRNSLLIVSKQQNMRKIEVNCLIYSHFKNIYML